MTDTNRKIALANTIGRVAVDLDLARVKALDSCAVKWITVGKNLEKYVNIDFHHKRMGKGQDVHQ